MATSYFAYCNTCGVRSDTDLHTYSFVQGVKRFWKHVIHAGHDVGIVNDCTGWDEEDDAQYHKGMTYQVVPNTEELVSMAKQMMNAKTTSDWFKAVRVIGQIVKATDFPAPTSAIRKSCGFGRRELRDMVRTGWLICEQIQNPNTGAIENGYYVKGGTVPSAFRFQKIEEPEPDYKEMLQLTKDEMRSAIETGAMSEKLAVLRNAVVSEIEADGNNPDDYHIIAQAGTNPVALSVSATKYPHKKDGVSDDSRPAKLADHQSVFKQGRALGCSVQVDHEVTSKSRT